MKTSVVILLTIMCLCVLIHSAAGHMANPDKFKNEGLSAEEKRRRKQERIKNKQGRGRRDVVGKIIRDNIADDEISDEFGI